jgi:hypothetical protein
VRCNRTEAIFLQKMLWLYSVGHQGVLFQLVFLLDFASGPHYRLTILWTLLILRFYLFLSSSVSTSLYNYMHPSILLSSFICFFTHSSSSMHAYLFLSYTLLILSFLLLLSLFHSLIFVDFSFLFPFSASHFFLLCFIWILSHTFKQGLQPRATLITKKQLTDGGNVILSSVTVRCGLTLCLSENNIRVYFKKQEMIHRNGKQM